jgi:glutamate N-acetyltransferase/amino-acid N-acetyltransferase
MSAGEEEPVSARDLQEAPSLPFFRSRWAPAPAHVRELGLDAGLPGGFRAAGVAAGIKVSGKPDVGLLVCDSQSPVSAARFTATAVPAAPVLLSRERCRLGALRAVLANSGCANAATGRRGLEDAAKTQGAAALAVGADPAEVALASTGGISHELPVDAMLQGILGSRERLRREGDGDFQQAIQTTDLFEKRANLELQLPSGTVRLSAQCKGAGMISPRFATMLCFVETDAALAPETADLLLGVCVKRSFDRASVDGQLSTNDTAILMCSGSSGVSVVPESEDELRFGEALDALLRALAIMMVADGEGAGRIARVVVRGGDGDGAEIAARAVANSPLVKAALHGGDPNWGRIVQAVGGALGGRAGFPAPLAVDVAIEGIQVCSAGAAIAYDEPALARAVQAPEVEYEVGLPGEGAETEVFFSDLSHEYVTVNADYHT